MAKFETHIKGNVGQQITGETVHVETGDVNVSGEIPLEPAAARTLQAVVENQTAEQPGFSEPLKREVLDALKAIALEQARALPRRAYDLLKQFFPSYVKPFLP